MTPAYWVAIGVPVAALLIFVAVTVGTSRHARRLAAMTISPAVRRDVEALQERIGALQDDIARLQLRVQMTQERAKAISDRGAGA